MDTDYAAPGEVDRIRARVSKISETDEGPQERETWLQEFLVTSQDGGTRNTYALPATFGILPGDGDLEGDIVVELEALATASERVLVSRRVRTGFVRGETRLIRMPLYRACAGTSCSAGETCGCSSSSSCSAPTCIDELVPPQDLEPIDDPGALPADAGMPSFDAGVGGDSGVPPRDAGTTPDGSVPDGGGINCAPPLSVCGLDCVNTEADPRYCGDCDTACTTGQRCDAGSCIDPGDCRTNDTGCSGFSYCDEATGECLAGCAIDEQCDGEHELCDRDLHECVCETGFEDCPSGCVDTDIDPNFCGSCDRICPTGNVCELGACVDRGDCRTNGVGCSGFTYCDATSGQCLRGCASAEQCTGQNETCDTATHECVCSEGTSPVRSDLPLGHRCQFLRGLVYALPRSREFDADVQPRRLRFRLRRLLRAMR